MKIEGRVAVVTGGARGIGKAIVTLLLKRGAKVCFVDVDDEQGSETVRELEQIHGEKVIFQKCDIRKEKDIRDILKLTKDTYGDVTIIINNAGILDENNISGTIAINLEAQIQCTMIALEFMGRNNGGKGGVVMFTSSLGGLIPIAVCPIYAAAKHGLVGFVRSMALSPRINDWDVRFNCVCPGLVDTNMASINHIRKALDPLDFERAMTPNHFEKLIQPSEVADAMIKLIEDETLNGVSLAVTKGKTTFVDPPALDLS